VTVLLVRHARAGRRDRWTGDDRLRPLSKKGRAQAAGLPALLQPWLSRGRTTPLLVSSPWTRCIATLAPIADPLDLMILEDDVLGEGMGPKAAETLPALMRRRLVIACTHGDVIEAILERVAASDVDLGRERSAAKGSVWVLEGTWSAIRAATYLPPPS
jgi:8-oxo-dGTP diphosphatase